MSKIGVFVCWCGRNIAGTVDVDAVTQSLASHPGVAHCENYTYMCSEPGQKKVTEAIKEKGLDGIVVAACSPSLHEKTFRKAAILAGLNPYMAEMANIREHCSWVHKDKAAATEKAKELGHVMIEKVRRNQPLTPVRIPVTRRALVIGAGVAGIQAALDIAHGGYEVVVVERESYIGGRAGQLNETFPYFENARQLLRPKLAQLLRDPRITLYTGSEVAKLEGYVGNFKATIRRRAVGGDTGPAADVVPLDGPARTGEELIEEEVGAIVVATGFGLYPLEKISEYGGGAYENVFTSLQFEKMLSDAAKTGVMKRPDGQVPKEVVFIQCVRSRDRERGMPYCSKICCMYTAKQAMLYKQQVPDGQAYIFYIDVRVAGKEYEDFIRRASEEYGVMYLRGRVSRVFPEGDKVMVWGADTLSGHNVEIAADAVVLASAMVPKPDSKNLAKLLGISYDQHGFFSEAHPKLRPVETNTAGIFLAGTCQAPKDIAESVAQASAAASKVYGLFASEELEREPEIARVNEAQCVGCLDCANVCAYSAISPKEIRDRKGNLIKVVASVNVGLCQGCGLCAATCRSKSIDLDGFTEEQLFAEIGALRF